MSKDVKSQFLATLEKRFGKVRKLEGSQSLFELGAGSLRIYTRYSKIHDRKQAFYGLRKKDLKRLVGQRALICFLWDDQREPLLVPFSHYEEILEALPAAEDGQIKAAVYPQQTACELYLSNAGRFNVEAFVGWQEIEGAMDALTQKPCPPMSHWQIQTLIGALGWQKGYDVWLPANNRCKLDWSVAKEFCPHKVLPSSFKEIHPVMEEIDVIWLQRGSGAPSALFEIEHSTPIYSGLLRFNDVHLTAPGLKPRFSIVADELRRSHFVRLLNRPTFRTSGLSEICTFLEYGHLSSWYERICNLNEKENTTTQTP